MWRKIFSTIPLIYCALAVCAQTCDTATFQRIYWSDNAPNTQPEKIVSDANGNNFILSNTVLNPASPTYSEDGLIIKTNKRGTPLWSKIIGFYGEDFINDIAITKDGGIIAVGRTRSNQAYHDGEGWYCKLNGEGNLMWAFHLNFQVSQLERIIPLTDGGFAVSGMVLYDYKKDAYGNITYADVTTPFVLVINADGSIRWIKELFFKPQFNAQQNDQPVNLLSLKDNNFIFLGEHGYATPLSEPKGFIIKINSTDGSFIWQQFCPEEQRPVASKELSNGDIQFYNWETSTPGSNDYNRINIFQTTKDGIKEWSKQITLNEGFNGVQFVENSSFDNEDVFLGEKIDVREDKPVLFKLKDTSQIEWAHQYPVSNTSGHIDYGHASYFNNQFLIDEDLVFAADTIQICMTQTDANGNTPCSIEEPLSVLNVQDKQFSFDYELIDTSHFKGKSTPMPVYAQLLFVNNEIECYKTTCCRDTVVQKDAAICKGESYTLPDGRIVDTASLYFSVLKEPLTNCDSIIYTNLQVQQPLKVSLGNDTCLQNENSLTYTLSYAPQKVQYYWQNGSTDSVLNINSPGIYFVKVSDYCSTAADTLTVYKDCALPIYMPTAFTPNSDGLNDIYRIPDMHNETLINFSIFNRYGSRIFSTRNPHEGWNGTIKGIPQQTATYIYFIIYADLKKSVHTLKGSFVLLR